MSHAVELQNESTVQLESVLLLLGYWFKNRSSCAALYSRGDSISSE